MSDITPPEYCALTDRLFAFYADERYDDALRLVDAESAQYPDRLSDLAHMAACLLAVSGRPGDALDRLLQADRPIPDDFPVRPATSSCRRRAQLRLRLRPGLPGSEGQAVRWMVVASGTCW